MRVEQHSSQSAQRVKVGLAGLAAVILLIGVASAIMRTVTRDRPVVAAGAPQAAVVANLAMTNDADVAGSGDTLADMGVTASPTNTTAPAPR